MQTVETVRHDADHGRRHRVDLDRLADAGTIPEEPPAETLADHGDRVVCFGEEPSRRQPRTDEVEIVRRDGFCRRVLGPSGTRFDAHESSAGVHRYVREGSLDGAVRVERVAVEVAVHIRPGLERRQGHELFGIGDRGPSQDDGVQQAAHRRGRADSEDQRDDDDQ